MLGSEWPDALLELASERADHVLDLGPECCGGGNQVAGGATGPSTTAWETGGCRGSRRI